MKAHTASLINALILIGLGLWAFFGSETRSGTALIPVGFGIVLAAMVPGIRKENKVIAHVAVLLTLLILIALIKPLMAASDRGDCAAVYRVLVMMGSSAIALFYFIKSFIDVRRARAAQTADGN